MTARPASHPGLPARLVGLLWPLALIALGSIAFTSSRVFGGGGVAQPEAPAPPESRIAIEGDLAEPVSAGWLRSWLLPAALVAIATLGFVGYRTWFAGSGDSAAPETAAATRTTIRSTIETSASVDTQESADLSFAMPGRVQFVHVKLGDAVQAGQPLADLDARALDNAIASAEANAHVARLRLTQLLNGASEAEFAAAEQAVSSARASRDHAADDLRLLEEGAPAADIDAARAAVTKAEASLAEAADVRRQVGEGAAAADIASADAAVAAAESTLSSAEQSADDAGATVAAAEGKLLGARAVYCQHAESRAEVCGGGVPLSQSAISLLLADSAGTSDVLLATDIGTVLAANGAFVTAQQSVSSSANAVEVAQANLAAAEEKRARLNDGADPAQLAAADAAVAAANDALTAARAKLADLQEGAAPEEIGVARSALAAAEDALAAAEARRADLIDGADADDVAIQRAQVTAAQLAVDRALVERLDANLVAPFAGVVAAINVHPGEYAAPASAAIVLLTPDALSLELVIGENDRPRVQPGQTGTVTFEALPNESFDFTIRRVGDAPTIEQGVAIYTAEASLSVPAGATRPVPGIGGVAEVLIEERAGALAVPSRALRRMGRGYVVDVYTDGAIEEREVTVGISDGQFAEITSGLAEGDAVVLRAVEKRAPEGLPTRERRLPGDIR